MTECKHDFDTLVFNGRLTKFCSMCLKTKSETELEAQLATERKRSRRMEDALHIACKVLAHYDCGCVCTDDVKPAGYCEKCWGNRLMKEADKEDTA